MPRLVAVKSQTINIHGGTGGNGGRGGVQGGGGGAGEGPILSYEIRAESVTLTNNLVGSGIRAKVQEAGRYRHPSLAQLFGFTCSAGVNALIYHDDMMTISQIRTMHAQSALASTYVELELLRHFYAANLYWEENTGKWLDNLPGTAWIRLSTGKLCLDIGDGVERCCDIRAHLRSFTPAELPSFKLTENELHAKLLCALKLTEFHTMAAYSGWHFSYTLPSSTETITLPSIWIPSDGADLKLPQTLAIPFPKHLTSNDIYVQSWYGHTLCSEVMPTGWTRVELPNDPDQDSYHLSAGAGLECHQADNVMKWWLSQQNYVCKHLQSVIAAGVPLHIITDICFHCFLNTQLDGFTLRGTFMTDAPLNKVYLFLFPPQVKVLNGQLAITNPSDAEKYYWAFDPAGLDRLTHESAEEIGLPTPEFSTEVDGPTWNECEYAMIREFHSGKDFDPESQDVAIAMGYPLVDIEAWKKSVQELTGKHSMDCRDKEVDDGIYYSLGLC
ncbi:hypothetical protein MVEN_01952200 [Mycena venus]|uniref:Uncharacterized protein n=1 Tax=Mycena venus TaxID=2733690 RepID=A0A8H7CJZ0_9AGAR|nr:hypothetical protein MVEN_01952200 [Mycena venus]